MFRYDELVGSAVSSIGKTMERWQQGKLREDESDLMIALQIAIDACGGLRWIEEHPNVQRSLDAPMRAGEFRSFDWNSYGSELHVSYHGIDVWLAPSDGEVLMESATASLQ